MSCRFLYSSAYFDYFKSDCLYVSAAKVSNANSTLTFLQRLQNNALMRTLLYRSMKSKMGWARTIMPRLSGMRLMIRGELLLLAAATHKSPRCRLHALRIYKKSHDCPDGCERGVPARRLSDSPFVAFIQNCEAQRSHPDQAV